MPSNLTEDRSFRIGLLADHREFLPTLLGWFLTEWSAYYGPDGPGDARADLEAYACLDGLPIGLVALFKDEVCGLVALKAEGIPPYEHLTPWVGAGLVRPDLRRRRVGRSLLQGAERLAVQMGFQTVYCATSTSASLLDREGWVRRDDVCQDGAVVGVYEKRVMPDGPVPMIPQ